MTPVRRETEIFGRQLTRSAVSRKSGDSLVLWPRCPSPWPPAGCWRPPTLDAGAALAQLAGQAIVDLAASDGHDQDAYVLTAAGLRSLS